MLATCSWLQPRWRRVAASALLAVTAAYAVYRLMADDESEEQGPEPERITQEQDRGRRPSFSVTDERGCDRGALSDGRAHQWGWLVDSRPLEPVAKPSVQSALRGRRRSRSSGGPIYDADSSEAGDLPEALSESDAEARPERKSVKFRLDEAAGFYGFVFNYDGLCVAHGADSSFVGKTLGEVLQLTQNTEADAATLHERFKQAAEAGGEWVSYAWRNDSLQKLQLKGAWISKITQWGQSHYAGIGYSLVPPPTEESTGMYGFVCTAEGLLLAHGCSPAFVGRTLAEVIEVTANTQIDMKTLLRRFHAAARLGGGWVRYPWRNSASSPLRTKGCFVTRISREEAYPAAACPAHKQADTAGGSDGYVSPSLLRPPAHSSHGHLFAGVGYFEASEHPTSATRRESGALAACGARSGSSIVSSPPHGQRAPPPAVPPSVAAAKAATVVLKELLLRSSSAANGDGTAGPPLSQLQHLVSDATGDLAAAAAEVTCWQAIDMPEELRTLLRDHATSHLRAFQETP